MEVVGKYITIFTPLTVGMSSNKEDLSLVQRQKFNKCRAPYEENETVTEQRNRESVMERPIAKYLRDMGNEREGDSEPEVRISWS